MPILSYGSEVRAITQTLDCGKWDTTPTKKSHLNLVKNILGVNRSVNNILCRAKLGKYPSTVGINCRMVNFFKHIQNAPESLCTRYLLWRKTYWKEIELIL